MHQTAAYRATDAAAILDPTRVAHLFPPQLILEWFDDASARRVF